MTTKHFCDYCGEETGSDAGYYYKDEETGWSVFFETVYPIKMNSGSLRPAICHSCAKNILNGVISPDPGDAS